MSQTQEYPLPLTPEQLQKLATGPWSHLLETNGPDQVWPLLRDLYSGIKAPVIQKLRDFAFSLTELHLSLLPNGKQWLTLSKDGIQLHLHEPPLETIPEESREHFPFDQVEGLGELLRYFGGMANWSLPPNPSFMGLDDPVIASKDTLEEYVWGVIGSWEGSLCIYRTGGGNALVVSPDGRIGKWDHEFCYVEDEDDEETPWMDLETDLESLIERFIEYQSKAPGDDREAPFYY